MERPANPESAERRAIIDQAITDAARRYITGCEQRIDGFVKQHYSFRGALKIHAHALGFDLIRVPVNILWSLGNIVLALIAMVTKMTGQNALYNRIKNIPPGLETDMDRQISWLVITELLQLPMQQGERKSEHDALMQEILKDPALKQVLDEQLNGLEKFKDSTVFREELDRKLAEYGATRIGTADLATNAAVLITSKLALGQASFGTLSAGTAVSSSIAHAIAVSNFWLGATAGSYYYAIMPVAVSMRLLVSVTVVLAIILCFISTFIGIITDPVQAQLGLHQRRLKKLVKAIEQDLLHDGGEFKLREKYAGRLFDVIDIIAMVSRKM